MSEIDPPADAPLPWTLERGYIYSESRDTAEICDANGAVIWAGDALPYSTDSTIGRVARYLVACANAVPGLVEEREKYRAELERQTAQTFRWHEATDAVVNAIRVDRDAALARVAALEQELARLTALVAAQAPVIEDVRKHAVRDVEWYGKHTRSWATDTVAALDRRLAALETP